MIGAILAASAGPGRSSWCPGRRSSAGQEGVELLIGPGLVLARLHGVGEGVVRHLRGLRADDAPEIRADLVRAALGEAVAVRCISSRSARPWRRSAVFSRSAIGDAAGCGAAASVPPAGAVLARRPRRLRRGCGRLGCCRLGVVIGLLSRRQYRRRSAAAAGNRTSVRSQAMTSARSCTLGRPAKVILVPGTSTLRRGQEIVQLLIGPGLVLARLHGVGEGVARHLRRLASRRCPRDWGRSCSGRPW